MIGGCQIVLSVTCACITCTWNSVNPREQIIGQLPIERTFADYMSCRVGGDFTGPFHIKLGHTCRPTIVKAYTCIFVCLLVKATHIEAVSNLSMEGGLYCLLQTQSDHKRSWIQFYRYHSRDQRDQRAHWFPELAENPRSHLRICISQLVQWQFIPEKAPHFGELYEAAVCKHEDSPMLHTLASGTELWRTFYCTLSTWSLHEQ